MESTKSQKFMKRSNKEDRISELHEDVLHHILSFLDMRTVVQSMVLSKRWRSLWRSLPSLSFTNTPISDSFTYFVDKALDEHEKSNIHRLHIKSFYSCRPSYVNSWIRYTTTHNVDELHLCVRVDDARFQLPEFLFTCQTIKVLKLVSYNNMFIIPKTSWSLCGLTVLHFEHLRVLHGDQMMGFLSSCQLKTLVIKFCQIHNLTKFCFASVRLQNLELEDISSNKVPLKINIWAPNLIRLRLRDNFDRRDDLDRHLYSLENLSALVKADIGINIRSLEVKPTCKLTLLSNLRRLSLTVVNYRSCIPVMEHFLGNSAHMETLITTRIESWKWKRIPKLEFPLEGTLDHLKTVEMKNFVANDDEVEFLKIVLKNALVLEKIKFTISRKEVAKKLTKKEIEKYERVSPRIFFSLHHLETLSAFKTFHVWNKQ